MYKILWDFTIQCDTKIKARRPVLLLFIKPRRKLCRCYHTWRCTGERKGSRKVEKYKVLKDEIARMWGMKEVIEISVVAGALGAISAGFEKLFAAVRIDMIVEHA